MRFVAALAAALAMLTLTSQATAFDTKKVSMDHRPLNCSRMKAPAMLRCAKAQLRHARFELRHINSRHSAGYWQWRIRVTKRWIRQARWRINHVLPATGDWVTAVRIVQRSWPGTSTWMLSCSAHEGGHGPFVMNYQGSGAGGWMQYMEGTFNAHYSGALALARATHRPVPPPVAASWTSPLGQAFAAGWGYSHNRSAWAGNPYC